MWYFSVVNGLSWFPGTAVLMLAVDYCNVRIRFEPPTNEHGPPLERIEMAARNLHLKRFKTRKTAVLEVWCVTKTGMKQP